jgi:hypothetical protein
MTSKPSLDAEAAAELHNRVATQIVTQILNETRTAGGTHSDLLVICESVLVGVVVECFRLGHDCKVIDLIFTAAKARLAKVRLEDLEARGRGEQSTFRNRNDRALEKRTTFRSLKR